MAPETDEVRVLVVGASQSRVGLLTADLGAALDGPQVVSETDGDLARNRLCDPYVRCLVSVSQPSGEAAGAFLGHVAQAYPTLPTVVVDGDDPPDADRFVDLTVLDDSDPQTVAAAVRRSLDAVERRRDLGRIPDPEDDPWPNVEETDIETVVAGGLDEAAAGELLHKSRLFDTIVSSLPLHLFVKDATGRHRHISTEEYGDVADRFLGFADPELALPEVDDVHGWRGYEDDRYVIDRGRAIRNKEEYIPELDQWNLTSKVPWPDPSGEVVGLVGVTRVISERKRQEREIREQNERLRTFADLLSHDLRNPLTVALGRIEHVVESADADREHLAVARDSLEQMDAIIEDALVLARQGNAAVELDTVSLSDTVADAWEAVDTGDATLSVGPGVEGTRLRADRGRLVRLLVNLFSNSVEHGPPTDDAGVAVTVERLPDGFAVADDGTGIPPDRRERVLEMGVTMSDDGTGFGLAIVEDIVDAHDWWMAVTESADGGARFEFTGVDVV